VASLSKGSTDTSEEGSTNFMVMSSERPKNNKMMTRKIDFAALFTEQQRLPPTGSRLLLRTVKKHEYFYVFVSCSERKRNTNQDFSSPPPSLPYSSQEERRERYPEILRKQRIIFKIVST